MEKEGLTGYVVPSTDAHQVTASSNFNFMFQSEYVQTLCSSLSMWLLRTSEEPGFLASLDPLGNKLKF